MRLNIKDWKAFNIQRTDSQHGLFDIENCKCGSAGELENGKDINYIGAKKSDNGVMKSVSLEGNRDLVSKGQGIMFICDGEGSVGYTNYMDKNFIGSTTTSIGYDDALNELNAMFLVTVLDSERFKYSYGRKYRAHLGESQIYLPIQHNTDGTPIIDSLHKYSNDGYIPDWQFMEDYIKTLHHKPLTTKNKREQILDLNLKKWKEFKVGKVLVCDSTNYSVKDDLPTGTVPFISRSAENNGVDGYVDVEKEKISKGNCITIGAEGIYAFYQQRAFATGNKVYQIRNEYLNKYIALFICTILNKEDYKYSYGRARTLNKLKDENFLLPIKCDTDGTPQIDTTHKYSEEGYIPDWEFMENYIKSLPYGDRLNG